MDWVTGEARGIGEGDAGGGVREQSDEGASELGSGGTTGVKEVAFEGPSFSDAVETADGTYDGRGFNGLGRSLSGRSGVVLV